jgi:hypothetical protein
MIYKSAGIIFYNTLINLVIVIIVGLLSNRPITEEIAILFSDILPVYIGYGAMEMGNAYNLGNSRDKEATKKYKRRYNYSAILLIPLLKATLFAVSDLHLDNVSIGLNISLIMISYLCVLIGLYLQASILWHTELSLENERKVEKFFS